MKPLTKKQRKIVIQAADMVATGKKKYICDALFAAARYTRRGDILSKQCREFFDLQNLTFEEEFFERYGEYYYTEGLRDMRVIALLTFAEVG